MAKLLLTSSQVSVLVSAFVIILCTLALFLSGYIIQQRTLQQLRVAIKPRPARTSPKVYLPDRFQSTTTELDDGTIVYIESEAERDAREQERLIEVRATEREGDKQPMDKISIVEKLKADIAKISASESSSEGLSSGVQHPDPMIKPEKPISRAERRRLIKQEIQKLAQPEEPVYYQRRLW